MKTSGSGQNRIVVPVFVVALPFVSFFVTLPRANAIVWDDAVARTSTSSFSDRALTTETPTPCSPPEMRVAAAAELPAGVQHGEDDLEGRSGGPSRPGIGLTGMPRPLS